MYLYKRIKLARTASCGNLNHLKRVRAYLKCNKRSLSVFLNRLYDIGIGITRVAPIFFSHIKSGAMIFSPIYSIFILYLHCALLDFFNFFFIQVHRDHRCAGMAASCMTGCGRNPRAISSLNHPYTRPRGCTGDRGGLGAAGATFGATLHVISGSGRGMGGDGVQ